MTDEINNHQLTTVKRHFLSSCKRNQTFSDTEKTRNDLHHDNSTYTHQRLPNEIITLIISHISKQKGTLYECALVSKQFHSIANSFLWKVLDFAYIDAELFFTGLCDTSEQRLAILAKPIRDLSLNGPFWTDSQFNRLLPHMPQLNHLKIYLSSITNKSFQHIPRHCPSLLSLTVPYDMCFAAFHHCRQLCELNCKIWHHPSSLWLLTGCPLQRLKIHGGVPFNQHARAALQSFDLVHLDLHVPEIERLMTLVWPRLTTLTLSFSQPLDEAVLIRFFQSHPRLTHLDLKYPQQLTQTTLDAMTRWLPHLQSVTIHHNYRLSNKGVRRWVQHNPSLVCATFQNCSLSTDAFPEAQPSNDVVHLDQAAIKNIKSGTTPPRRQPYHWIDLMERSLFD